MEKRSLSLAGHRTSLALETEFWAVLEEMATRRAMSLPALIGEIDRERIESCPGAGANLASAVRTRVVRWLDSQRADPVLV